MNAKFCRKCQIDTERNSNGKCKPCAKAYNAAWRSANPERAKAATAAWEKNNRERHEASTAAWRARNSDRVKAVKKAWDAANAEHCRASYSAWRAANPDVAKAATAAWRSANPDKVKADNAAWHRANPAARRIHEQNRNARKRASGGVLSKGLSAKLFELQRGKCACCKLPLGEDCHLDHILPICLGGPNIDSNMQLLRSTCNQNKHAKHPIDFMQERGFLL